METLAKNGLNISTKKQNKTKNKNRTDIKKQKHRIIVSVQQSFNLTSRALR